MAHKQIDNPEIAAYYIVDKVMPECMYFVS